MTVSRERENPLSTTSARGSEGTAGSTETAGVAPAPMHPARRRRLIIAAVLVAVILITIIAIFVVPNMFKVYKTPAGLGMWHAPSTVQSVR